MLGHSTLTTRPYALEDIPDLVDGLAKYLPDLPHYKGQVVDRLKLSTYLRVQFSKPNFMCHVCCREDGLVVGAICAYSMPFVFNDEIYASDIFLFIREEYRNLHTAIELINAYVQWAQGQGASIIAATTTSGYRMEAFERLLERYSFKRVGSLFHYTGV